MRVGFFLGLLMIMAPTLATAAASSGIRSWDLSVPASGHTGFTAVPAKETGVFFTNALAFERSITNHVLLNGSGVAAGDVDGDGRVDLYFCGLDSANKLFRNLGNWRFEDITDRAGVACPGLDATGAALADLDGDGDLDLVVNSVGGGTFLFLNDGHGRFTRSSNSPRLNEGQAGTSLALADIDGDGALDLYVTNYRPYFFFLDKAETRYSFKVINGQPRVTMIDGRPLTDPEYTNRFTFTVHAAGGRMTFGKEELGQVDALYQNDGKGGFTLIPFTGGSFQDEDGKPLSEPPRDWGLSVMFHDLNGDGWPDVYVCNDFRTPDRIWLNDGHGRFRAAPRLAIRQTCLSAMCVDIVDINRDGYFDIFVADMLGTGHVKRLGQRIDLRPEALPVGVIDNRPQFSRNMLQLGRGDGTFAEIAQFSGLEASDWTWAPIFVDVDLDGYLDLLVANGFERDTMNVDVQNKIEAITRQQKLSAKDKMNLRRLYPRLDTPNLAFRNLGDCRFENVSAAWGFNTPAISQGMCLADLDNDGDLDVAVNNFNGPAGLYRNDTSAPRLAVRLKGAAPNTRGIGARVEVFGGPVYQDQELICGGRYCSSDDPMMMFAVGDATNRLRMVVHWRSGKQSTVDDLVPNRLYEVDEAAAVVPSKTPGSAAPQSRAGGDRTLSPAPIPTTPALYRDVSSLLQHVHHEEPFDDFQRQPLLPWKLSQLGPAVAWSDLDGDGWDDLVIGNGRGSAPAIYRNNGSGAFELLPGGWPGDWSGSEQAGLLGWARPDGQGELIIGFSNYEAPSSGIPAARSFVVHRSAPTAAVGASSPALTIQSGSLAIPAAVSSTGPLALADVDGDGVLELFVGGRVIPGRYPESGVSRLFHQRDGVFEVDRENSSVLEKAGLVSGAVFSDLDSDGYPELILACEWGPIRVFRNDRGTLREATRELQLDRFRGWWQGVNAGDFDGDGRMDIVAANWGRNSRYEHFRSHPLRLSYGDFNGDGSVQLLEAYFAPDLQKWVPWRRLDDAAKSMPFLSARFSTFEEFGKASVDEILAGRGASAVLEANWLESTVFLNRGDHFDPVVLPFEAQLAPAFAPCVGDLDGDGAVDIFLSQNFFDVPLEVSRYDAGRSLWLRGDGHGRFSPVDGVSSGLMVYGEQRGAALCDYDADGRLDLVVTQNGAQTRLFHNDRAQPGLRVRFKGPPRNREGIGTALRGVTTTGPGPLQEVHAGAGYWSQDSAVLVVAVSTSLLEVHWPGGRKLESTVPPNAKEIEVDDSGKIRVIREKPAM